ncbi:MAG: T9SS type A sorting domain-containing protein, partial [Bacteroidota bacterium]
VTDDSVTCQSQDFVNVQIAGSILNVNGIAVPPANCPGSTAILQAFGSGGSGNYSYLWSGPNNFNSTIQDPVVQPIGSSTYYITINDGFTSVTDSVTVNVLQSPIANAGNSTIIPFGTYTFLHGLASGGSGNYFYSWSPASKLINPGVKDPQTKNLTGTTVYSLSVTDNQSHCNSLNNSNVTIEVVGGALTVNPVAIPNSVCPGDSTQLHASGGGGNTGFYQYTWSSNPPGFHSSEANPYVNPIFQTDYYVTINDGFNTAQGNTEVTIYPIPVIRLGPPDSLVCIYDTIELDAGNPGSFYLWSNGSVDRIISAQAAGVVPETQTYHLTVTNPYGCVSSGSINLRFSFSACTGIALRREDLLFDIYPNPNDGIFTLHSAFSDVNRQVIIADMPGKILLKENFKRSDANSGEVRLDFSQFPDGIYFVRLISSKGAAVRKIIIRK